MTKRWPGLPASAETWESLDDVTALTLALQLAVTAPTEDLAGQATRLADRIAAGLTPAQVEGCKAAALARLHDDGGE